MNMSYYEIYDTIVAEFESQVQANETIWTEEECYRFHCQIGMEPRYENFYINDERMSIFPAGQCFAGELGGAALEHVITQIQQTTPQFVSILTELLQNRIHYYPMVLALVVFQNYNNAVTPKRFKRWFWEPSLMNGVTVYNHSNWLIQIGRIRLIQIRLSIGR